MSSHAAVRLRASDDDDHPGTRPRHALDLDPHDAERSLALRRWSRANIDRFLDLLAQHRPEVHQ